MVNLHDDFLKRMKILLENDYCKFLESLNDNPAVGIRINTLLVKNPDIVVNSLPFKMKRLDFLQYGFRLIEKYDGLGKLPAHHAGAFYVQDPSAMTAVCALDPQPGDRVLDLCAAPGGKSTQIAACLNGEGLLVANEIKKARVNDLISNLERMGVKNAVVFSKTPSDLISNYREYFDKVLVDAPCSCEGMFRKNPHAVCQWSAKYSNSCAVRQKDIMHAAAKAVRPGGTLVYSTCTFSVEEDEEVVRDFLEKNNDFVLEPIEINFGSPSTLKQIMPKARYMRRIFPYQGGEGHFVAKLKRKGNLRIDCALFNDFVQIDSFNEFWVQTFDMPVPKVARFGDNVMIVPKDMPKVNRALRVGILAGSIKNNRFIPKHHLFKCDMKLKEDRVLNLSFDDDRVVGFLKGEEIPCSLKGYLGVKVSGIPLGFGKVSNGKLKNHYPKGLRLV